MFRNFNVFRWKKCFGIGILTVVMMVGVVEGGREFRWRRRQEREESEGEGCKNRHTQSIQTSPLPN
jgi:hypothetical protein